MTREDLGAGVLADCCRALSMQAGSPAELQFIPYLYTVASELLNRNFAEYLTLGAQTQVEGVGRVDYFLALDHETEFIFEIDGLQYHDGQESFRNDRSRDRAAIRLGIHVIRVAAIEVQQDGWKLSMELLATIGAVINRQRLGERQTAGEIRVAIIAPGRQGRLE